MFRKRYKDNDFDSPHDDTSYWIAQPLIFIALTLYLVNQPATVMNTTPAIISRFIPNKTAHDFIYPIHELSLADSFHLGQISQRIDDSLHPPDAQLFRKIIATITKRNLTWQQYNTLVRQLDYADDQPAGTLWSKVYGLLKLSNLMILFASILGLVTVVPFTMWLLSKLPKFFLNKLAEILTKLWHLKEPLMYIISFLFLVDGMRIHTSFGLYITITGCLGFFCSLIYSDTTHPTDNAESTKIQLLNLLTICVLAPLAIFYQSTLLGFMAIVSLYTMIGFSVMCLGMCWCIGFKDEEGMNKCVSSSLVLIPIFTLLRLLNISNYYLYPFSIGVFVFANIVYFLGLLIMTAMTDTDNKQNHSHKLMILSLLVTLIMGSVFNLPSIFNTALTFGILYVTEQLCVYIKKISSIAVVGFLLSVSMYFTGVYLHSHPEFVISLFDSSFMLTAN